MLSYYEGNLIILSKGLLIVNKVEPIEVCMTLIIIFSGSNRGTKTHITLKKEHTGKVCMYKMCIVYMILYQVDIDRVVMKKKPLINVLKSRI